MTSKELGGVLVSSSLCFWYLGLLENTRGRAKLPLAGKTQLLATLDEEGPVERIIAEHEGAVIGSVLPYPPLANSGSR